MKYNIVGLVAVLVLGTTCWGQTPCVSQQGLPCEIALVDTAIADEPAAQPVAIMLPPRVLSDNAQAQKVLMNLLNRTDLTKKENDSLNAHLRNIVLYPSASGFYLPDLLLIRDEADRRLAKQQKKPQTGSR